MMRYLAAILLFFSCSVKQPDKFQFSTYPENTDSLSQRKFEWESKILNLSSLNKGVDSLEIRIWPWEAFDHFVSCFVFKADNEGWRGYHYFSNTIIQNDPATGMKLSFRDKYGLGDSVLLVKQITPSCGWKKFSDSLAFFKIYQLPTQSLIKDFKYHGILDGDGLSFEIATDTSYRSITYSNPRYYDYEECNMVQSFWDMMQRQLGNDYCWPRCNWH